MIDIDVRINDEQLRRQLRGVRDDIINRATASALNKAAGKVKTETSAEVRQYLLIPSREMGARIRIDKASRNKQFARVATSDYDPSLARFSPRWKQKQPGGATVKLPNRGTYTVLGAFTARAATKRGQIGVFRRKGRKRTPLVWLRASDAGLPTVGQIIEKANRKLTNKGMIEFQKEFERQLRSRFGVLRG